VLYYDNGRLDSRLSYTWRSEYLPTTAGQFGASVFVKPYGQLDFSINYKMIDNLQLTVQATNLTRSQLKQVTRLPGTPDLPTTVDQLERRVLVGVRYSL